MLPFSLERFTVYDSQGLPIGMQYHGASYAADTWDTFWFEKNLQGDIVAVYSASEQSSSPIHTTLGVTILQPTITAERIP